MDAFVFLEHPVLFVHNKRYYDEFRTEWAACRLFIRNIYGSLDDSLLGLENVVKNTERMKATPGVLRLKDLAKGYPAIICSAGPSLKKSLPLVRELQDKCLIIAVDAVLKSCLDAGVIPHFVCTMERGPESQVFFHAVKDQAPVKSQLVYYAVVPDEVIRAFPGESWIVHRDYTYMKLINQKLPRGVMSSGTSVAHMATKLANYLGVSSIHLVGQDLCFDPDSSETHLEGVDSSVRFVVDSEEKMLEYVNKNNLGVLAWVPGNLENKVRTHSIWYAFIKEFSHMKRELKAELINCTEGGAQIPDVKWQRLEKASENWTPQRELFSQIQQVRKEAPAGDWSWEEAAKLLRELQSRLILLANEAKLASELEDKAQMKKACALLMNAKRGFEENPFFFALVMEMIGREHLELENQRNLLTDEELKASRRHFQLLENWFSSMNSALRRVIPVLQINPTRHK